MNQDEVWMREALKEAQKALQKQEVPVGAVIVHEGQIIARAHNLKENLKTPLGHAEVIALHRASQKLGAWRLSDCTLYVTLEPCLMCAGVLYQARIGRVVFATKDPKAGALGSVYSIHQDQRLNHRYEALDGPLQRECSQILKDFFKSMRMKK
jgi:tRNA(adenine34) deaminase